MKRIQLWTVADGTDGQVRAVGLEEIASTQTEERLEELLVASPELLLDGISLIGRQLPGEAGSLDLLGIDQDGRLVLLELKRGTLTRDAVAQILDYVSELSATEPDQLARLIEEHSGRRGIEKIDDFADWYGREFPNSDGPLDQRPRMILVGLGVDGRARRIVNFLADSGIDIQLLTFHAFGSGDALLLARQVETMAPVVLRGAGSGPTKQENRQVLFSLAERQGVKDLLVVVSEFIQRFGPFYRWPGKTAYSYSLQERTKEGRPTSRSYLTLWVHHKKRETLVLSLAPRALEVVGEAAEGLLSKVPGVRKMDSSWTPVLIDIDAKSWPVLQDRLASMLDTLVNRWKQYTDQHEGEGSDEAVETAADADAGEANVSLPSVPS